MRPPDCLDTSIRWLIRPRKTQIALAYVYWLQNTCWDVSVFWVHASTAERFRQGFMSIAKECDIPGHDDPKADVLSLVKTWLRRKERGRWLMVIDNADDTDIFFQSPAGSASEGNLARYIPECGHGSVLIMTRNKQTGSRFMQGKLPIEIGKMEEGEADQLIRAVLHKGVSAVHLTGRYR